MATAPTLQRVFVPLEASRAMTRNPPLALDRIAVQAMLIIGLLLINKAGVAGAAIFFAILFGMILKSPDMAFKAFTLAFLGLVCNQAIVPKTPIWTVGRLLIPAFCLAQFLSDLTRLRASLLRRSYFVALVVFLCVAAVLSIMTRYFTQIALLKIVSFAVASTAIFAGAESARRRGKDFTEWFVTLCAVTAILGFGSIVSGIGYNMRGIGTSTSTFNGPFYHSNTLGPIGAMMVVYLANVVIFGRYRNRWLCLALAVCLVYFMALTQSRTAFGALFVGMAVTIALTFFLTRRGYVRLRMNLSRTTLVGVFAVAAVGMLFLDAMTGGSVTRAVVTYANKGGKSETIILEQVIASRQVLVEKSWDNFLQSPLIGIGFEVSTAPYFVKNATIFNAPIEKGFLPVAVLEETGIIGTFFFVIFLLTFLAYLAKDLNIPGLALFLSFLAVNCGEAMFFSMGGHGAFAWLWCAGGIMLGNRCVEHVQRPVPYLAQAR